MEQRSLRLGDIVDDYCPRERRVTNHAIVAIVEDAIRQTRCTTCDHEHAYKHAREPRRRTRKTESLYEEVLADITGGQLVTPVPEPVPLATAPAADDTPQADPTETSAAAPEAAPPPDDGWLAHRTLIRAQLPRIEGETPPPRPIPEFTMHQRPQAPRGRGGFRFNGQYGDSFGNTHDGRPGRGSHGPRGGAPRNGNGPDHGNGDAPGKNRGRGRRRGKRR